ncbi:MAG: hypothetical protein ABFD76_05215 [Smithella sp.]
MDNPYGATAAALKDTRLTLRDIAAGILANKKMESDLKLGEAKANTETAMVQAGITRDQLHNDLQMASLSESTRANKAREANDTSQIGIAQKNADTQRMIGESTARMHNAQTRNLDQEAARANEVLTANQYAMRMGAPGMPEMLGIDPNTKQTAAQWAPMGQNILGLLKQSPAMQITYQGYKIKSQLEGISRQYNTPGLDAKTKTKLKKDMEAKYDQLQRMDNFIMSVKEPDAAKVAGDAQKFWIENQGQKILSKYTDYNEFLQDYTNDIKQTRGVFHNDLARLQRRLATMDISPTYDQDIRTGLDLIASLPDTNKDKKAIMNHINDLQSKKDYAGLYQYVMPWAKHLTAQKKNAGKHNSAVAASNDYDGMM